MARPPWLWCAAPRASRNALGADGAVIDRWGKDTKAVPAITAAAAAVFDIAMVKFLYTATNKKPSPPSFWPKWLSPRGHVCRRRNDELGFWGFSKIASLLRVYHRFNPNTEAKALIQCLKNNIQIQQWPLKKGAKQKEQNKNDKENISNQHLQIHNTRHLTLARSRYIHPLYLEAFRHSMYQIDENWKKNMSLSSYQKISWFQHVLHLRNTNKRIQQMLPSRVRFFSQLRPMGESRNHSGHLSAPMVVVGEFIGKIGLSFGKSKNVLRIFAEILKGNHHLWMKPSFKKNRRHLPSTIYPTKFLNIWTLWIHGRRGSSGKPTLPWRTSCLFRIEFGVSDFQEATIFHSIKRVHFDEKDDI